MKIWPVKKLSNIKPSKIVSVFENIPLIQARSIVKQYYLNLAIKSGGIIGKISDAVNYFEFVFKDKDGVSMLANFDNPVNSEVYILKKGDRIDVVGKIANVAENIVVLDHCLLLSNYNEFQKYNKREAKIEYGKWYQKRWENSIVQGITFLAAILGIIGFLLFRK